MKIFTRISNAWQSFFRRRRLSLQNPSDNREEWYTHISPMNMVLAFISYTTLLFIIILTLVGYTPILESLPMYRTDISRSRDIMIENILRIDSMERVINDMMRYQDNIALIMDGRSPVVRSSQLSDSTQLNKAVIAPNAADSILRQEMEGEGEYSLQKAAISNISMRLIPPVEGEISQSFDIGANISSMKISMGGVESKVAAASGGVVFMSMWNPESNYIVGIQHPKGLISIYKNLSQPMVTSGDMVKSGSVIGYTQSNSEFEFELWEDGKPVNPQNYIIF